MKTIPHFKENIRTYDITSEYGDASEWIKKATECGLFLQNATAHCTDDGQMYSKLYLEGSRRAHAQFRFGMRIAKLRRIAIRKE